MNLIPRETVRQCVITLGPGPRDGDPHSRGQTQCNVNTGRTCTSFTPCGACRRMIACRGWGYIEDRVSRMCGKAWGDRRNAIRVPPRDIFEGQGRELSEGQFTGESQVPMPIYVTSDGALSRPISAAGGGGTGGHGHGFAKLRARKCRFYRLF